MSVPMFIVFTFLVMIFDIGILGFEQTNNAAINNVLNIKSTHDNIFISIMIHLDKALIERIPVKEKLKRIEKFKHTAKIILNDVERIFMHPSFNLSLNLTLINVEILKNDISNLSMDENVSKYLKSYCQWQGEMKMKKQQLWYSMLFTGLDLFYIDGFGNEVRSSTGRGYMKGMCSLNNSCTLLEWQPRNVAYVLAHEIAHSLGVSHDGPPLNECNDHRYIMDALYDPNNPAKTWSKCSKIALDHYLNTKQAWCLRPEGENVIIVKQNIKY